MPSLLEREGSHHAKMDIIVNERKGEEPDPNKMSLQESVLAYGGYYEDDDASTTLLQTGDKMLPRHLGRLVTNDLVEKYSEDPIKFSLHAMKNLRAICQDETETPYTRKERFLKGFIGYISLIEKLDLHAFPGSYALVYKGFPSYRPNNSSDLGFDPNINEDQRNREKIILGKREILEDAFPFISNMMWRKEMLKKGELVREIMTYVNGRIDYDRENLSSLLGTKSLSVMDAINDGNQPSNAVCRHIALYNTALLQTFGIKTRHVKMSVKTRDGIVGHAANMVKLSPDHNWIFVDATNMIYHELPTKDINFNEPYKFNAKGLECKLEPDAYYRNKGDKTH